MNVTSGTKLYWLLKRELWEHRGGFLWTPIIAGGIFLLLNVMGIITAEVLGARHGIQIGANGGLQHVISQMDAGDMSKVGFALDIAMYSAMGFLIVVLGFVVFFYCLGALYDDRRDRSILFWKSLPVSDRDTVLSKVACATVLAPAIAIVTSIVTGLLILVMLAITASFHGANLWQMLWTLPHPFRITTVMLSNIPLYVLWALPTVGWLMLCSAWARSKPFLWALIIPVGTGMVVSWFNLMGLFNLSDKWFWSNVVGRALLSVIPGGWIPGQLSNDVASRFGQTASDNRQIFANMFDLAHNYAVLVTPEFLIGAVAGVAMLIGAIWLRRWRDDS